LGALISLVPASRAGDELLREAALIGLEEMIRSRIGR
jgi:hypothetical protein